jgi:hypothetical protein
LIDLVGLENMHVCATPVVPIILCGYHELHFMRLCKHTAAVSAPTSSQATWASVVHMAHLDHSGAARL